MYNVPCFKVSQFRLYSHLRHENLVCTPLWTFHLGLTLSGVGYINNTVIICISNELMSEKNVNYRNTLLSSIKGLGACVTKTHDKSLLHTSTVLGSL